MDFNKSFPFLLVSNDHIMSQRPGLKTEVKNVIFWSEIRRGFGEPGDIPPSRISWSTPRVMMKEASLYFINYHSVNFLKKNLVTWSEQSSARLVNHLIREKKRGWGHFFSRKA